MSTISGHVLPCHGWYEHCRTCNKLVLRLQNNETFPQIQNGEEGVLRYVRDRTDRPTFDMSIISNFQNLRNLYPEEVSMSGKYPFLFQFPNLRKVHMENVSVEWDLKMLSGLPMLKDVYCVHNGYLTRNLESVKELKNTLQK